MKLWIIYKNGIGFPKIIAEMLQDRLEDYLDVSVGGANKVNPAFLVEEKPDFLIIGDVVHDNVPSKEIQNWLKNSQMNNLNVKILSGFYIVTSVVTSDVLWEKNVIEGIKSDKIYPPMMQFRLNNTNLNIEEGAFETLKRFSNDFTKNLLDISD